MIDLKTLQSLAASDTLTEADSISLNDFNAIYAKELKAHIKDKSKDPFAVVYDIMKKGYLKQHKDSISFVAEGSSRAVFLFPSGKCLKIATSNIGRMQNSQEMSNCEDKHKFTFIP